jgi:methionyl-tRNA synthetase
VPVSAPVAPAAPAKDPKITYDDFAKVEIKAGKILSAEKIPNTDKLLKLSVDFAEAVPRQIVSGISMYFPDPAVLVGRTAMFVTNLEPRAIKGFESNGMLFALSTPNSADGTPGAFSLLEPKDIPPGTRAK